MNDYSNDGLISAFESRVSVSGDNHSAQKARVMSVRGDKMVGSWNTLVSLDSIYT